MKKLTLVFALTAAYLLSNAQTMNTDLTKRLSDIEDRIALKNIVDTFSILADHKDIQKQVLLFTENATVASVVQGQAGPALTGRKQIGDAFTAYLNLFETVYHINGQQTIALNGNTATAISYCLVVLIGKENGKQMKTTMGVYYNDEFVRENNHWLIAKRTSNFAWRSKEELTQ